MNNTNIRLYVCNDGTLKDLKSTLVEYQFFSIAYFFYLFDNLSDFEEVIKDDFGKAIIDITNLIRDGNYLKIFSERYLYLLYENFSEIHFCINQNVSKHFFEDFPYFFGEEDINWDFNKDDEKRNENHSPSRKTNHEIYSTIYTYKNISTAQRLHEAGNLISLSDLVDVCEEISFQYNTKRVYKALDGQDIEYVDLSSIVKMLKLRSDLIFSFEILMHRIASIRKVKYCVEFARISDLSSIFPLCFSKELLMDDENEENYQTKANEKPAIIDITRINTLSSKICERLRGHDAFKMDFRYNLLKFAFLNQMGERKILSIMLCGDSGIGKTQFVKFVSEIIFPEGPFIKINFGNCSTEGVLNSLIGSPLRYVGSEEGGELINKISISKSKIILIDEFEKATPSVYNFFYELLEDGIFTDRHGIAHNLDGYIIVFTSNMTETAYREKIPDSLKSRFDTVYYFVSLPTEEKHQYIQTTALELIENLERFFGTKVIIQDIQTELDELVEYDNLRDIRRKVEDIVFNSFLESYEHR